MKGLETKLSESDETAMLPELGSLSLSILLWIVHALFDWPGNYGVYYDYISFIIILISIM